MVPFLVLLPLVELDSANLMQVCVGWGCRCSAGFGGSYMSFPWPSHLKDEGYDYE